MSNVRMLQEVTGYVSLGLYGELKLRVDFVHVVSNYFLH